MLNKLLVGIAAFFVLGAVGFAVYQNTQNVSANAPERFAWQTARPGDQWEGGGYGRRGRQGEGRNRDDKTGNTFRGYGRQGSGYEVGHTSFVFDKSGLDEKEAEGLTYMREEEKLARDVYLALYDKWGLQVFANISRSEQRHMDAVKILLDGYQLDDPASEQRGVFTNPDLQSLYDKLVAQGEKSISDALKVGGAIEEIDILDLQKYLAATDDDNIKQVFENLERGSENHLRAFSTNYLQQTGNAYQPQYMDANAYQTIVQAARGGHGYGRENSGNTDGRGRRGGMHGRHGNGDCQNDD